MTKITAVLFDLDGVLVDATEWHYEALNRALSLMGFAVSRYEHLSEYNGLPTRKKLEMLSVEKGFPTALHTLINRIKQVYTVDVVLKGCRPVFEKEYMISRLKREGYGLAVCSNAVRRSVDLMLSQSNLQDYFDLVLSNEDITRPKPDPDIYLTALDRLGCSGDEAVIVEDAPHGIEAAERAGGHVCKVAGVEEVDYTRIRDFICHVEAQVASS